MFQNKSTALPLRSQYPVHRTNQAPTDENRQTSHARMMHKDSTAAQTTKVFGGIPAYTATRVRINNSGLNNVVGSKIAKADSSSKTNRTRASRVALTSKLSTNTTANANSFGARRAVRSTLISAGSMSSLAAPPAQRRPLVAVKPVAQNKPAALQTKPAVVRTQPAAIQNKPAAFQTKPAALQAKPAALQAKPAALQAKPAALQAKPVVVKQAVKPVPPLPQFQAQPVVTVSQTNAVLERAVRRTGKPVPQKRQSSTSSSSTLVPQEKPKPVMPPVPCLPIEPVHRFVNMNIVERALRHSGPRNEQPITVAEIEKFDADLEYDDHMVVPDFNDDIFGYMREVEVKMMANPNYMHGQRFLTWASRRVLLFWLVEVHSRFELQTETLHLAMNYVDRVLSSKEVQLKHIQLMGIVCLFLACKYEEKRQPNVREFVFMTEGRYMEQDMLSAERHVLRMLDFDMGWPGPMSFLRRLSKADSFSQSIRTTAKYLVEVTLVDKRFIGVPSSKVAAVAYMVSMRILGRNEWTRMHAYYAGYFESELLPLVAILMGVLIKPERYEIIYSKYSGRLNLWTSEKVFDWLKCYYPEDMLFSSNADLSEL